MLSPSFLDSYPLPTLTLTYPTLFYPSYLLILPFLQVNVYQKTIKTLLARLNELDSKQQLEAQVRVTTALEA